MDYRDPETRVREAAAAAAAGRPVVLVDDSTETADLILAGARVTAKAISFVVLHSSGVIQVGLPADLADQLRLPPMWPYGSEDREDFAVSVDAGSGISTGISARDRARTVALLADPQTQPDDLTRPGHVLPVRTHAWGPDGRPGRAEAAVELARSAGLAPVAGLCALVSPADPRRMADSEEAGEFAAVHDLSLVSIGDLVVAIGSFGRMERSAEARAPCHGTFRTVGAASAVS